MAPMAVCTLYPTSPVPLACDSEQQDVTHDGDAQLSGPEVSGGDLVGGVLVPGGTGKRREGQRWAEGRLCGRGKRKGECGDSDAAPSRSAW